MDILYFQKNIIIILLFYCVVSIFDIKLNRLIIFKFIILGILFRIN